MKISNQRTRMLPITSEAKITSNIAVEEQWFYLQSHTVIQKYKFTRIFIGTMLVASHTVKKYKKKYTAVAGHSTAVFLYIFLFLLEFFMKKKRIYKFLKP